MAVAKMLRDARARRGLTLEQVANETKIGLERLSALECDGLPPDGSFYSRARLRAYAQALGLDYRIVLEQLNHELLAAAPVDVPEPPTPQPRRFGVAHVAMTAAGCVVFAMIATAWLSHEPRQIARSAASAPSAPRAGARPRALPAVNRATSAAVPPEQVAEPAETISTVDVVDRTAVPVETSGVLAPVTPTSLVIVTQPQGARVTVDGIGWGTTPVTISNLPEGLKRIRVTNDGYAAAERAIEIQPNRANQVAVQLKPLAPAAIQEAP